MRSAEPISALLNIGDYNNELTKINRSVISIMQEAIYYKSIHLLLLYSIKG